ncbi:MAG: hypothetical protein JW844_05160 [Candidatus Omnitrophica bacterium]|nr:hypothetical protein [Candidatus Omnitrophota bacterium]
MKHIKRVVLALVVIALTILGYKYGFLLLHENAVLKRVISRLEADSRIAEVLVTGVNYNEAEKKTYTTIKFLEYTVKGEPLEPLYFTFSGNIIQFQSLVIRFNDIHIRQASRLRDRSAYLFWKVFMLDGPNTREYEITRVNQVPGGYRLEEAPDTFEARLWERFWQYALDPEKSGAMGIKNAQIEAPGTMFIPGIIYTIKIEHDGGMRIDTERLPAILRGETIPK